MVNTELLESYITDSGKKKIFLAKKMGIAVQTLRQKSLNNSDFTSKEIEVLCSELGIKDAKVMKAIFFASKVGKEST